MPGLHFWPNPRYLDKQGKPITLAQWVVLSESWRCGHDYRRVGWTEVGDRIVSTVWLGLDHGFGGPPMYFESAIFGPELREVGKLRGRREIDVRDRYPSLRAALRGHAALVEELRSKLN
jgi:hypothetical protein